MPWQVGSRFKVPPRGVQPASIGTLRELVGRTAVLELEDHPGDPLYIDADVLLGEWRPANNGSGPRMYFLIRDAANVRDRYRYGSNGNLIRYSSNKAAQKVADRLNKEAGF